MDLQILIIYELDFWLPLPPSIHSHPDPQRTDFYNNQRPHQSLNYLTPAQVHVG